MKKNLGAVSAFLLLIVIVMSFFNLTGYSQSIIWAKDKIEKNIPIGKNIKSPSNQAEDKFEKQIHDWAKDILKVESVKNKVVTIKYPWKMAEKEIAPEVTLDKFEFEVKGDEIIFKGIVDGDLGKGNIFEGQGDIIASGILRKEFKKSSFKYKCDFEIRLKRFKEMKALNIKTVNTEKAELDISSKGLFLKGELNLDEGASFYAGVELKGKIGVEAYFRHDFEDWYFNMDASDAEEFTLFKVPLKASEEGVALRLWPKGIDVKGMFDLGPADVKMEGKISSKDVEVKGSIGVDLPLHLAGNVVDKVTDGAICGYETVTDGAICGYNMVTDAGICGTEEVVDSTKCGYKTVTNAEKCGEKEVKSITKCGTHTITSGAKCGWDTFSCWVNPFKWGKCKKAESCKVVNSCKIPKTCKIAERCKVPKTCKDYNLPKTCQDLNKPKTCERHHLGDYVGDIKGDINLKINQTGLNISADAKYCAKKECDKLDAEATYHAKKPVQICFDINALHGFENAEGKACIDLKNLKK